MYIPQIFRQEDAGVLAGFIRENSFGTLVTIVDELPFATPLPFQLDAERGPFGVLRGHMARSNPQWQSIQHGNTAMAMFQGPHGYISPSWYTQPLSVPTWNYMALHAYGEARITSNEELVDILRNAVETYEGPRKNPWRMESLPDDYIDKMVRAIVGFEIEITSIEGKFKLGQNRSEDDISNVINELQQSDTPGDLALAEAMRRYSAK